MQLLEEDNAADYLRAAGRVERTEPLEVRFLSGGVSNVVLYVHRPARPECDFVLKQARAQLRVPQPWFCSVERIWREVAVLEICERVLQDADKSGAEQNVEQVVLPRVLFEDRDEYLFAMTAAPLGHSTWKQQLLAGNPQAGIARACGRLLGTLHAQTWLDCDIANALDDRQFFDDLRLDPYFRQIARVHPDLQVPVQRLLDSVWSSRRSLVHGDFSPKNLLVWPGGLMLIDCEVGHYGDPAFDLGFFLTHLILKSLHFAPRFADYFELADQFWLTYRRVMEPVIGGVAWGDLEQRAQANTAGCLLARIDGKSRVDYLQHEGPIRRLARSLLLEPAANWRETAERVALCNAAARQEIADRPSDG